MTSVDIDKCRIYTLPSSNLNVVVAIANPMLD
jgi:hypothetical protein